MAKVRLVLFRESDGSVPLLNWFDTLPPKALVKCRVRLERLAELGHDLRRPEADYLRDGIHELRVGLQGLNYRMLYFFHARELVVLSHGIVKQRVVPPKEIEIAVRRKAEFEKAPRKHTYLEEA